MEERLLGKPEANFAWLDTATQEDLESYRAYGEAMLYDTPNNQHLLDNMRNIGIALQHIDNLHSHWIPTKSGCIKANVARGTVFPAHGSVKDPRGMAMVCKGLIEEMDTVLRLEQVDSIPKREWNELNKSAGGLLREVLKRTPKH